MEKQIPYNNKAVSYEVSGQGPALVLLHGFLESKEIWHPFTTDLQQLFTVVAVDLPGHGKSQMQAETHTMQLMAETVKAVLQHEKINECVICGHSMGGYTALQLATELPGMLKGLVLFHSHAAPDSEETRENRRRTINIVKENKGGYIRQFIPQLFDEKHVSEYSVQIAALQEQAALMRPEAVIAALAGMRDRESRLDFLLLTDIPVLFVIGKQDSRMAYSQVLAQAVIPAHSEVLLLENVGHMGFVEAPEITCNALKHFALRCFGPHY